LTNQKVILEGSNMELIKCEEDTTPNNENKAHNGKRIKKIMKTT